jgi:hypothetical protein
LDKEDSEVYISGATSTEDEWRLALVAPVDQLPSLSAEELEAAKRYGGSGEEFRRSKLANAQAVERLKSKGRKLRVRVREILARWASDCELKDVLWQGAKSRWMLRIREADNRTANVPIPAELADDVVDPSCDQDVERLKNLLLFGVGRQELILRH